VSHALCPSIWLQHCSDPCHALIAAYNGKAAVKVHFNCLLQLASVSQVQNQKTATVVVITCNMLNKSLHGRVVASSDGAALSDVVAHLLWILGLISEWSSMKTLGTHTSNH